jgi:raffinose/stachyose/melibiose transport system substrate-binding protein
MTRNEAPGHRNLRRRRFGVLARVAVTASLAAAVAACGGGAQAGTKSGGAETATLTLWDYADDPADQAAVQDLVPPFEQANPGIKVHIVTQPSSNYFQLLTAAEISHTQPDLALMWTGLYLLQYQSDMLPLQGLVPSSAFAQVEGLKWASKNLTTADGPMIMPLSAQFYNGYYNKKDFTTAGVTTVPTDWTQLFAACAKLKKAGITPIVFGNGSASYSGQFNPFYDMSYLMMIYSPTEWENLYNGNTSWTSAAVQGQLQQWHQLYTDGCTNSDALTDSQNIGQLESGKAAMATDDGSWDVPVYEKAMGSNVGILLDPFSNGPQKGIVYYPGNGFAIMRGAPDPSAAGKFLAFMTTPAGVAAIAKGGDLPDLSSYQPTDPLNKALVALAHNHVNYPMLDNVTQPDIVNVGQKFLPSVLSGAESVSSATNAMKSELQSLPAAERTDYASYAK